MEAKVTNSSVVLSMHEVYAARFIALVEENVQNMFPLIGLRYVFNDTVVRLKDIQNSHEQAVWNLRLEENEFFSMHDLIEAVAHWRQRMVEIIEESKVKTVVIVGFDYHKGSLPEERVLLKAKEYIVQEAGKFRGALEHEGEFHPSVTGSGYYTSYYHIAFKD